MDTGLDRLSREMQELTKAIHELRSEMSLLKYRLEQVERQGNLPRPLMALIFILSLIVGWAVYSLSAGG